MKGARLREHLCFLRPGEKSSTPPTPALEEEEALRAAVDPICFSALENLVLESDDLEELENIVHKLEESRSRWVFSMRNPAVLALGFAVVLLTCLIVWSLLEENRSFPGQQNAMELLAVGTAAEAEQYEPVSTELRNVGDWLAMNGVDGFWTPSGFESMKTVAARVFSHANIRVATFALPDHQMMVYVFDGAALGIEVEPAGTWQFLQVGRDVGAIAQRGNVCFLVAIRGDEEQLRELLEELQPRG